ncbi:thioredoxin family protein [Rhodanobacter sp. Si-c]|uniref:Thioredoxin family protein n=1 Tax=Rhodanobacter lycopersici TaxID=3162487 RepID=A0ABV3QF61_9GAMM
MRLFRRLLVCVLMSFCTEAIGGAAALSPGAPVPEFAGIAGWLNSPPLSMASLHGKVVLVDFWAYSCINCIRALPHVEHLYQAYKDKGLVVVGVHTPEFDFEANPANVQAAVQRLGITYPVAMDSHGDTWNAWHNQFWPAEYLIDQNGRLLGHHYGEGAYDAMENAVRALLGLGPLPAGTGGTGQVAAADDTPELHLGSATQSGLDSSEASGGSNGVHHFSAPVQPAANNYALNGVWQITDEYAQLAGRQGEIRLRFKAAKVYVVASAVQPVTLQVMVDGKPQPAVTVHGSQLYTLYDGAADGEHVLVLHVPQKGLQVYSFTFG